MRYAADRGLPVFQWTPGHGPTLSEWVQANRPEMWERALAILAAANLVDVLGEDGRGPGVPGGANPDAVLTEDEATIAGAAALAYYVFAFLEQAGDIVEGGRRAIAETTDDAARAVREAIESMGAPPGGTPAAALPGRGSMPPPTSPTAADDTVNMMAGGPGGGSGGSRGGGRSAGRGARPLQRGGRTIERRTADALNEATGLHAERRDWGRALEELKSDLGLRNDHHGAIGADGSYMDESGEVLGYLQDYLP